MSLRSVVPQPVTFVAGRAAERKPPDEHCLTQAETKKDQRASAGP
jgi:hypothetical protein